MRAFIRNAIVAALAAGGGTLAVYTAVNPLFEGREHHAYLDIIGKPTICEGWTHGVRLGDVATPAQCDEYARQAFADAWNVWVQWVPEHVRAGMGPVNESAFLLFITNVGTGRPAKGNDPGKDGFVWLKSGRHSTMLLRLRAGDLVGACDQFRYWANAGGKPSRGLAIRRVDETGMCHWPATTGAVSP